MDQTIYLVTLVAATLVVVAAFSSLIAFRFGAPLLLLFLAIGLASGTDGLGIEFDNASFAYFVGSLALAVILFDSGFGTPLKALRQAAMPAIVAGDARRGADHGAVRCRGACHHQPGLAGIAAARRCRGVDRRRGRVLPAARRQREPARAGALDAGNRIRHQRPDRHLPHHHAGGTDRARRAARYAGHPARPRRRLLPADGAGRGGGHCRWSGHRAAGRSSAAGPRAAARSSC